MSLLTHSDQLQEVLRDLDALEVHVTALDTADIEQLTGLLDGLQRLFKVIEK